MRLSNTLQTAVVLAAMMLGCGRASATSVYIAQTAAGASDGSSCTNAYPVTFFNSSGNWGSGASQIGPGTVVYLCGTITSGLQINGSGTSGNVIEVVWTAGARISVPYGQIINLNGNNGYLLFDGGIACGPGTSCDTVEAATQTGYATGQTGIIEATANGSALANQSSNTDAFYGCNSCHDIEIRNLIIRNLYVHSSLSDTTSNIDTGDYIFQCPGGNAGCASGTISIHDNSVHDVGTGVSVEITSSTTVNVYNIDFYHMNWAIENSGNGSRTLNFHDSACHDTTNWDTTADAFHHNCQHNYTNNASDSVATNLYNIASYGNWGSCCTTATLLYGEITWPNNFNVYNNICLQYSGNIAPCVVAGMSTGVIANNTMLGVTGSNNVVALQIGGANLTVENNVISGYGQFIYPVPGTTFSAFDYNRYGTTEGNGNSPWQYGSTGANTFSAWQSACSCDAHGGQLASFGVNSAGVPQAGSALIGAGANLTSLGIIALESSTSAGGSTVPTGRPASGAWTAGAYVYSTGTIPPTALTLLSAQ